MYKSFTIIVFPYLAIIGDCENYKSYFNTGEDVLFKRLKKDLNIFKKKHKVEWNFGSGDAFDLWASIFNQNETPITQKVIDEFKKLLKTYGQVLNEIYHPHNEYKFYRLKQKNNLGFYKKCYCCDLNNKQFKKNAGTTFYWQLHEGKQYKFFYKRPLHDYN